MMDGKSLVNGVLQPGVLLSDGRRNCGSSRGVLSDKAGVASSLPNVRSKYRQNRSFTARDFTCGECSDDATVRIGSVSRPAV